MENNDRTALIERLRDATEGPRMLMGEAADMLEADAPAVPKTWHLVGYYHKAESADECDFYFKDVINDDCPDCHPCYADTAALEKPAPAVPQEPNNDEVICPACCTQFRAIPVNVQQLLLDAGFEPPFKPTPQQQPRLTDDEIFDIGEDYSLPYDICSFARAIEAKVRGEA